MEISKEKRRIVHLFSQVTSCQFIFCSSFYFNRTNITDASVWNVGYHSIAVTTFKFTIQNNGLKPVNHQLQVIHKREKIRNIICPLVQLREIWLTCKICFNVIISHLSIVVRMMLTQNAVSGHPPKQMLPHRRATHSSPPPLSAH